MGKGFLKQITVYIPATLLIFSLVELKAQPSIKIGGYTQTTAIKSEDNKAFVFGFERVRIGASGSLNGLTDYKFLVDFVKSASATGPDGSSPGVINFAQITYKPTKKFNFTVGKFKTPLGMEWNTGATSLDIVKRGLGQSFIFHFDVGAMATIKEISSSGIRIDAGIFNAGPNKATEIGDPAEGQDYTLVGRIQASPLKALSAEASFGTAVTSIDSQKSVNVFGVGAKYKINSKIQVLAEYLSRSDEMHTSSDGSSFYVQAGYLVCPRIKPLVKFEKRDVTDDNKDQQDITIGLNFYLNPQNQKEAKIIFNYVHSDVDGAGAIQLLFQGAF